VLRGESDQCGPTYETQTAPQTCEWFVHDFPDGLPEGRHAIWAVWEAPCSAWADLGFTVSCDDPYAVMSVFSSGFDAPYGLLEPSFSEVNEAQLSPDEIAARYHEIDGFFGPDLLMIDPASIDPEEVPAGDVAPSGDPGAAPPVEGNMALDTGVRLPLGERRELPDSARLDFLNTRCWGECFRDAVVVNPADDQLGIGVWAANEPFHIRQGFVNETTEPLSEAFDVVVSITRQEGTALAEGAWEIGHTYRFTSDYVLRDTSAKCGPGYWDQTGLQTCEWFVHDFPNGLAPGRYDIWAEWFAPCSAWLELGLTETCADSGEVMSRFASSVNMPFYSDSYSEGMPPPYDPATLFAEDPRPITRGIPTN
jgi:hypothetical protein